MARGDAGPGAVTAPAAGAVVPVADLAEAVPVADQAEAVPVAGAAALVAVARCPHAVHPNRSGLPESRFGRPPRPRAGRAPDRRTRA